MHDPNHPDAVTRLRLAIWGAHAPGDLRAAAHVAACDTCAAEAGDVRRVRDATRDLYAASPSPSARAAVQSAVEEPALDFTWVRAVPVPTAGAFRGAESADDLLRCEGEGLRLDVHVHAPDVAGPAHLSGQVLLDGREPGASLEVTLFLDRRPAGTVRTDGFGEFTVPVRDARRIGLRVRGAGRPLHAEVVRDAEGA